LRRALAVADGLNLTRICSVATTLRPEPRSTKTGIVRATRVASRPGTALTTAATGAAAAPDSCMSMKRPKRRTAGAAAPGAASLIIVRDATRADSGPSASANRTPMSSGASSSSIRVPDWA
jgi:hypothetical protein